MKYVALLRGINVGGNKKVPMADLKDCLEKAGMKNVKTLLNSGNVVFETDEADEQKVLIEIEHILEKRFGWQIAVVLRTADYMRELVKKDPFKNTKVTSDIRLYVSFLKEKQSEVQLPNEMKFALVTDREICYVIDLSSTATIDAMKAIEKTYRKTTTTTRNWNTVQKLSQL